MSDRTADIDGNTEGSIISAITDRLKRNLCIAETT